MACIRYKKLLSAYLDDELKPRERLGVETHLHDCSGCRRYHRQLERTRNLVRDLDRMEAPLFAAPRARARAGSTRTDRAARWERIRGHSLAQPRPFLRPLAFAAVALVLVVMVIQGTSRLSEAELEPNQATEISRATPPTAGDDERPDWLKREIARRVLEAKGQPQPPSPAEETEPTAPEPQETRVAALPPETTARPAGPAPVETGNGAPQPLHPGGELIARLEPPAAEPSPAPLPVHTIAATTGDDSGSAANRPSTRLPSATPVATIALLPTVAATPGSGNETAAAPPATPSGSAQARAVTPAAPGATTVATTVEIGTPVMMVAVLIESSEEALAFVESDALAALREAGDPVLLQLVDRDGPQPEAAAEIAAPDPDPRTGIVRPVALPRGPLELGDRLAEVRDREELAPLGVRVTIDIDGNVVETEALTSSGLEWLDEAVVEAVREWTFRPAERDGEPTAASLEVVVDFDLD